MMRNYLFILLLVSMMPTMLHAQISQTEYFDELLSRLPIMHDVQINLPEDIDQRVDTALQIIEQDSIVYITKGIGMGGSPTVQYQLADHLKDTVSTERMKQIALTHRSPIVRGAIFHALLRKDAHAAIDVAIEAIDDMTPIVVQSGCYICGDTLSIMRINYIIQNPNYYHVSDTDLERICEVVLLSKDVKRFDTYGKLYEVLKPKEKYYERLKELFDKVKYTWPLQALVKYNKEEDKRIVLEMLKTLTTKYDALPDAALNAVAINPDERYTPYLREIGNNCLNNQAIFSESLYAALMTIEEPWVVQMIDASITKITDNLDQSYNRWNLHTVYSDRPVPYFKEVYEKSFDY